MYPRYFIFSFLVPTCHSPCDTLGWGLPLCLQLNRCPCPPRDWMFYVYKILTFSSNGGGGEQTGTLGKNGAWGDATCTCPRTCVPRPCSSLCMVTRVLALQVWLSTCSMVSGREESSMCRLHSWAVDDYPKYTWDGLTLNLFCSITFIVKVTHKQQHCFIFFCSHCHWQPLQ